METEKLNPYFSIWRKPRAATRFLLENRPLYYFFGLAAIFSLIYYIETALFFFTVEPALLKGLFTQTFFFLSFWSYILFFSLLTAFLGTSAIVFTFIAYEFGAKEPIGKTFSALVSSLICTLPWGLLPSLFLLVSPYGKLLLIKVLFQILCALGIIIFPLYSLIILIKSIAEAQEISSWKASLVVLSGTPFIASFFLYIYYVKH